MDSTIAKSMMLGIPLVQVGRTIQNIRQRPEYYEMIGKVYVMLTMAILNYVNYYDILSYFEQNMFCHS